MMSELGAGNVTDTMRALEERLQAQLHPDLAATLRERQLTEEQIKEYHDLERQLTFLMKVCAHRISDCPCKPIKHGPDWKI